MLAYYNRKKKALSIGHRALYKENVNVQKKN